MKFISITPEKKNASDFVSLNADMPAFVKLYSPSCGHCVAMQESWNALKNSPELKDYDMAIIEVHADDLDKIDSPAMKVNGGFPTIRKVFKNGKLGKDYDGDRSTKDMIKFIKEEFEETLKHGGATMRGATMRGSTMSGGGRKSYKKRRTNRVGRRTRIRRKALRRKTLRRKTLRRKTLRRKTLRRKSIRK